MTAQDILSRAAAVVEHELLPQYEAYVRLQAVIRSLEDRKLSYATEAAQAGNVSLSEVLRNQNRDAFIADITKRIDLAKSQLASISDAMKFDTPVIWMMYKHRAYLATPGAIETLADFATHCSKPGYICTKRFTYLNDYLSRSGMKSLSDADAYPLNTRMPEIYELQDILGLANDPAFMEGWRRYEYHHDGERIAKWENYPA